MPLDPGSGIRDRGVGSRGSVLERVLFVLALVLGAASGLTAIDEPTAATLEYVSEDSSMVSYANVRALMDSPLRDRLREIGAANLSLAMLQEWTGVNLDRDVDDVVMAEAPTADGARRALVVFTGRFDARQLELSARQHGARIDSYGDARIVSVTGQPGDAAISLPLAGLALVGDQASVRHALDAKAGAVRAITDNVGFMSAVSGMDDIAAWSVASVEALVANGALQQDVAAQLPPIDWLAAGGRFGPEARAELRAQARDAAGGEKLRELLRGFIALARMQGARNRELQRAMSSATLGGEGASVTLSITLTPGLLGMLDAADAWRLVLPR